MFSLSSLSRRVLGGVGNVARRLGQPTSSAQVPVPTALSPLSLFTRGRGNLAPKQVKYLRRHKGRVPVPIGGSTRGTTLAFGEWGIRVKGNGARITAKQLQTVEEVIHKKLKVLKGAQVYMRVFPHLPVCVKGNETRMGKGKGTFEYWACRVPIGRVLFEIGGVPIREELARDILRIAAAKLPTEMEFIHRDSPARLGNMLIPPPSPPVTEELAQPSTSTA